MWNDTLKCRWLKWDVYTDYALRLWVPSGDCPDMEGCCKIGSTIMPAVCTIYVVSGDTYINRYELVNGSWKAD